MVYSFNVMLSSVRLSAFFIVTSREVSIHLEERTVPCRSLSSSEHCGHSNRIVILFQRHSNHQRREAKLCYKLPFHLVLEQNLDIFTFTSATLSHIFLQCPLISNWYIGCKCPLANEKFLYQLHCFIFDSLTFVGGNHYSR